MQARGARVLPGKLQDEVRLIFSIEQERPLHEVGPEPLRKYLFESPHLVTRGDYKDYRQCRIKRAYRAAADSHLSRHRDCL